MLFETSLLAHQSLLRTRRLPDGSTQLYDVSRKRWLVATPEEYVRQLLVLELQLHCGFLPARLRTEKGIRVGGRLVRIDVLAVDALGHPLLLAECKRPTVPLNQETIQQTAKYLTQFDARYVLITNGLLAACFIWDGIALQSMGAFPNLKTE